MATEWEAAYQEYVREAARYVDLMFRIGARHPHVRRKRRMVRRLFERSEFLYQQRQEGVQS